MKKPLSFLRNIDVRTGEEEKLLQAVINKKVVAQPPSSTIYRGDIPDIRTKEDEDKWQKIVDQRVEAKRPKIVIDEAAEEETDEDEIEDEEDELTEDDKAVKSPKAQNPSKTFCESCDSKGKTHKKYCPKSK